MVDRIPDQLSPSAEIRERLPSISQEAGRLTPVRRTARQRDDEGSDLAEQPEENHALDDLA